MVCEATASLLAVENCEATVRFKYVGLELLQFWTESQELRDLEKGADIQKSEVRLCKYCRDSETLSECHFTVTGCSPVNGESLEIDC